MFDSLRKLTLRRRLEGEMNDEIAFHMATRADDLERSGLPRTEAERRARIEFGGVERYKEDLRQARRFTWFEDFLRDLAYGARNLRRSPLFVVCAAGALALGIGLNAALFSLVYGVLFRPLPVADAGNVRDVYLGIRNNKNSRSAYGDMYFLSWAEFSFLRSHAHTADLAGVSEAQLSTPLAPTGLHAQLISSNLLAVCGATPAAGRFFLPSDDATPNSGAVAVLSYSAWQRYFQGRDVVGTLVTLNRTPFQIVGVASRGFDGVEVLKADLWIPLTMQPVTRPGETILTDPNAAFVQVLARRRPGQSESAMRAELEVLAQQTLSEHAPGARANLILSPAALVNYPDVVQQGAPGLAILLFVVSLVLLAACANVAGMLIARGFSRTREIAIRLSMGAGKGRLVRQLLTEHMLLGLLGGIGGFALAQIGMRFVLAAIPNTAEVQVQFAPDARIALWTLAVTLVAGCLFGLPSALSIVRRDLAQAARGDSFDAGVRGGRFRLQTALTATQVAISSVLVISAALLGRAAISAIHFDPGHAMSGVLVARPNLRELQYTPAHAERYLREMRVEAAKLPSVTKVSWTGFEPVRSGCGSQAEAVRPDGSAGQPVLVSCNEIAAGFFNAMRIRLLSGRDFDARDETAAARVMVVDEGYARRYLGDQPLGRRVRLAIGASQTADYEVIGVAASTHPLVPFRNDDPQVYTPLSGVRFLEARLVIAYSGPAANLSRSLTKIAAGLDGETALDIRTLEDDVASAFLIIRIAAACVAALGALALVLACTGVYGVVAFTTARRLREIGIRYALGAKPAEVVRLLLWQSLRPALIGAALGAAAAAMAARLLRALLYGVSPLDPIGFFGAAALLAAIAVSAALIPALAATRVDPASTLRHD